ncbi:hypothetical protein E2562_024512 [Oryza meyeriana var. granulata]|uniref:Uncharacterized protein n=1 Tax=Oryza meyeriana var. granulata TaxID=110450 RepID=A0A6G1BN95_9ORYZ|nr:hypothetical protein E2562_024512 [Oryza meyeriana var. granulata]
MDRLMLLRPPKPTSAAADGDLLERDVLWPASSAPGLLAALPEDEGSKKKKRAGPAVRSAARPVPETAAALTPTTGAAMVARSAPVRIPSEAARRGRWAQAVGGGEDGDAMVPPHEIVARRAAAHSSVLEGAGRTLKGRDLRRVRNAVLRRTGFLD